MYPMLISVPPLEFVIYYWLHLNKINKWSCSTNFIYQQGCSPHDNEETYVCHVVLVDISLSHFVRLAKAIGVFNSHAWDHTLYTSK
jgi:hypothetical protein